MKTLKYVMLAVVAVGLSTLFAQTLSSLSVPRIDSTPTMQAEKGSVYAAATENAYWLKGGGNDTNSWTKFNFVPLSGALSGSAVLVNGTVTITNASLTINSTLLLTGKGVATNAGTLTYTAPTTNGVTTITSTSNGTVYTTDNRTVNWLSVGN